MKRREDIQRVVDKVLARQFKPQRVILFGSQAHAAMRPKSPTSIC